ncbi:putative hydrolase of the HAD superfamily [Corynebacterium pollutisoli]|uniref:Putative hydrolase of the HAD superfamily n=1 Tax=Corynebacterium pollutisoli TaxID=1610489 RepID=A0A1X7IQ42_9CORY|nr:HAD family phosphatase [Corynebacterium pollutisoli]SMG16904.1 putative hydrolase of the HAD superfamily [Corynebacterium pollutisoli]
MKAVLFDLFGVLLKERDDAGRRRVELAVGGDAAIWPIYEDLRPAYDSGDVGDERFWRQLQVRAGLEPFDITEAVAADWESTIQEDEEMVSFALSLIDDRVCTGILSNLPAGLAKRARAEHEWLERVDAVTMSCDIGLIKPDPRAYAVALDAMGVSAKDTVYVDADPVNVAAAAELGMQAVHFTGIESVREALR